MVLLLCVIAAAASAELTVHFLDVGQGDAAILECDGQVLMIDGGDRSANQFVYSYLRDLGIDYIDYMISTHPHDDHVQGLATALVLCDVGTVYSPVADDPGSGFQDFKAKLEERNAEITVPHRGDSFNLGTAVVTFVSEPQDSWSMNDRSLVVLVKYDDITFLFTGDAAWEAEYDMLASGIDLQADVLKVGHHGSATSTSKEFLAAVDPAYAIISVGEDNKFGHPAKETLLMLQRDNISVFRTDIQGTIVCSVTGDAIGFKMTKRKTPTPTPVPTPTPAPTPVPTLPPEPEDEWLDFFATFDTEDGGVPDRSVPEVDEEPQIEAAYIGNKNTRVFHLPTCGSVIDMKEKNRIEFYSREEAIDLGYKPCSRCGP